MMATSARERSICIRNEGVDGAAWEATRPDLSLLASHQHH